MPTIGSTLRPTDGLCAHCWSEGQYTALTAAAGLSGTTHCARVALRLQVLHTIHMLPDACPSLCLPVPPTDPCHTSDRESSAPLSANLRDRPPTALYLISHTESCTSAEPLCTYVGTERERTVVLSDFSLTEH